VSLTTKKIDRLTTPGLHHDSKGLYLQVSGGGHAKSWLWRYKFEKREHMMGLGSLHDRSLEEARAERDKLRKILKLEKRNPLWARREAQAATRAAAVKTKTFREAAAAFLAQQTGWSTLEARQFRNTLEKYAIPLIGDLAVNQIEVSHVVQVLTQPVVATSRYESGSFWQARAKTASRVRQRIQATLDHARKCGWRSGDNPAELKLLPLSNKVGKTEHFAAMDYRDLPAFMSRLRASSAIAARALEFAILTAARTAEVLGARWGEVNAAEKVWIISAQRMKMEREHRVPLSERCMEILQELPREGDYVFVGSKPGERLGDRALRQTLKMLCAAVTTHGFRSTFRDWCSERTNQRPHIIEAALAHLVGNAVERAYARSDLLAKRARLMQDWANFCAGEALSADARVVPLGRGRS
jgi:integrase